MSRVIRLGSLVVVGLLAVLLARAFSLQSLQPHVEPLPVESIDVAAAATRLAEAVRFETVSHQDPAMSRGEVFDAFQAWLARSYPRMHDGLARERTPEGSLVYTWRGSNPSLDPALLLAHQDVVPASEGAERWTHPPFSGEIADGFVWGRGSLDDKSPLVGLCETVEHLVTQGFVPVRTLLFAFGHDEEVGGSRGAALVAKRLSEQGVRAFLVLDEGMGVLAPGMVPGLAGPLAGVGIAEKGYVTLELRAELPGGHSSTPARETAIGAIASAVRALVDHPMPGGVRGPAAAFFDHLAPEVSLPLRLVLANRWLFDPFLVPALSSSPASSALLRTTTAPTMLAAGEKENVIPPIARAWVNFRILPGDQVADVVRHAERTIGDPRVAVVAGDRARPPSAVSPIDSPAFDLLRRTIRGVFPDAIVTPTLTLAGTDSRHYGAISENVYRFAPFRFDAADLSRIHGIDERISIDGFRDGLRFYRQLLRALGTSTEGVAAD